MNELRKVVLTREAADNLPLETRLRERNIPVLQYPCIKTTIIPFDAGNLPENIKLDDYTVVAFTSRRGVTGMKHQWENLKKGNQILAVVGKGTAKAVRENIGRDQQVIAEPATGEALARQLSKILETGSTILHVRGNKTTGTFQNIITANGFTLHEIVVYKNETPENEPLPLQLTGIVLFASPSAVKGFFKVNGNAEGNDINRFKYVAIGATTAEALFKKGITPTIAPSTDVETLELVMGNMWKDM